MAISQHDIAIQMVQQLRLLDPSVSAEVGTPERKIIDTVAEAIANAQVSLNVLGGAVDIDAKLGSDLDRYFSLFGFARQNGAAAVGVVEFSRPAVGNAILIPENTLLASTTSDNTTDGQLVRAVFATTESAILEADETTVIVPIKATTIGSYTNVPADSITTYVGTPVTGVPNVTNPVATRGGLNVEPDDEAKVRFKNTLFRNVAGTEDQFLALAVAGAFTNKANVIGPISRYREYVQVPPVDDASSYDVDDDDVADSGNGSAGEYTTTLSTIPYSEYTYDSIPTLVSNGQTGVNAVFYNEGIDYEVNVTANKNRGDAYRYFLPSGGIPLDDDPEDEPTRPNVTFLNVYEDDDELVEAVRPEDVVLVEHSYISSASRNDFERNITNCIDVYVNGVNETAATTVIPPPVVGNAFVNDSTDRFHYDDYRRIGEPEHRPVIGNVFSPLFWNPLSSLPESIELVGNTFIQGVHYWPIYDVSEHQGTVRARTGIEWSIDVPGQAPGDDVDGPYTGDAAVSIADTSIEIPDYTYNRNIYDLQTALEAQKQVTTDVLVHEATIKYLKFDLTIMYTTGFVSSNVNQQIQDALSSWLNGQHFGAAIQLSDILQVVHNIAGVDNVRWSKDVDSDLHRVALASVNGEPILGGVIDRATAGTVSSAEVQHLRLTGTPNGGTYTLDHELFTAPTAAIAYDANAATVKSAIDAVLAPDLATLTGSGTLASPFIITFGNNGFKSLITIDGTNLTSAESVFASDFFLQDDELPALPTTALSTDTLAGLIIRERAANTWTRA